MLFALEIVDGIKSRMLKVGGESVGLKRQVVNNQLIAIIKS